jgi:hypothetical protein
MPDLAFAMRLGPLLLAATLPAACGPPTTAGRSLVCAPQCSTNEDCVADVCVPLVPPPQTWYAEITPPLGSDAALTEKAFSSGGGPFTTYAATTVTVTVSYPASIPAPTYVDVALTIPPVIPGRPDLTFEDLPPPGAPAQIANVPSGALDRTAQIALVPLPPDDATTPPRTFPITLAAAVGVTVGGAVANGDGGAPVQVKDQVLAGILLEADRTPPPANVFTARVFAAGSTTAVSNRAVVGAADGGFSLLVPAAAAMMPLVVELVSSGADPSFTTSTIMVPPGGAASVSLGTILLPPYTSPNQFSLQVQDGMQNVVEGAIVTASTTLSQTNVGSSSFTRGAVTAKMTGGALLSLLPGTASTNLSYEITVVPPVGSILATSCRAVQMIGVGGTLPAIMLPPRRKLSGRVTIAGGAGVPNVVVSATPGPTPVDSCTRTRAAAGSTITDAEGRYVLPLDPGSYQVDYDPAAGSPYARVTNPNGMVTVTANADPGGGDVALPAAGLVEGTVNLPDGKNPLPRATVRIFEPRCSGDTCSGPARIPPLLLGQAQTDAKGQFRIVVASP